MPNCCAFLTRKLVSDDARTTWHLGDETERGRAVAHGQNGLFGVMQQVFTFGFSDQKLLSMSLLAPLVEDGPRSVARTNPLVVGLLASVPEQVVQPHRRNLTPRLAQFLGQKLHCMNSARPDLYLLRGAGRDRLFGVDAHGQIVLVE